MPIDIDALLIPISADEPSGSDLRYQPVTDKIKEARRQDDNLSQGVWERELKTADYIAVMKLAKEALTKQSKDLQIAAWLTEALARREGFPGLQQGLDLMKRMLETFWDTVYPQIDDDGDLELRATPLSFVGQLAPAVRSVALSNAGHSWYQYRESRAIPTEQESFSDGDEAAEAHRSPGRRPHPTRGIRQGDWRSTPVAFSQKVHDDLVALMEQAEALNTYCLEKFGDVSPDLGPLRTSLEEVHQTSRILLIQKGGLRSGSSAEEESIEPAEEIPTNYVEQNAPPQSTGAAPQRVRRGTGVDPADGEDAVARLLAAARFLRKENPYNATPYLISRALRWGEVRSTGGYPDAMFLAAPPSDVRMELKRLSIEGQWEPLREAAEEAAGLPCGRAWVDVHRYSVMACRNFGLDMPAQAIISGLRSLLADFPQLLQWELADGTPVANAETTQWLTSEMILPVHAAAEPQPPPQQEWFPPPPAPVHRSPHEAESANGEPAPPEAFELAMQAARGGRIEEAFDILTREIAQERSGRARFLRRIELAQVCLATGNQSIALPILQELSEEIEHRGSGSVGRCRDRRAAAGAVVSRPAGLGRICRRAPQAVRAHLPARSVPRVDAEVMPWP